MTAGVPTLIVLCGMPGSGKSTWADTQRVHGAIVVSCDAVRHGQDPVHVFNAAHNEVRRLLAAGGGGAGVVVIFDACCLQPYARTRLLHIGHAAGARCELVFFCTPMLTCAARNALRGHPARVEWLDLRSQARAAYRATQTERWDLITYEPGRDPFM